MRIPLRLTSILLLLSAIGCQSEDRLGPSGLPQGTVTHVVFISLYDRADKMAQNEILAAGQKLEKISGVIRVSGGVVLPSNRAGVDNSFDVAFVMTFRNEADLNHYLDDPAQVSIKQTVLDRYAKKYVVYDFVNQ
jgi:hypothetical protein